VALAAAGSAAAFQALPPGGQVNDDAAAGIHSNLSVAAEDPTNADVVGGALVATKPAVPWAIFQQTEQSPQKDQIFSRSFASGAWTTRGSGTVGGRSSSSPTFTGSLNFDQAQDGEVPAIDFAGAGRTVPWATWYENTTGTGFGADNIFASRFDNSGDANQGKWIFEGQGRGTGGSGPQVPSLNIHTNRDAVNPSIAGGATVAGNAPVPWVTWQEKDGAASSDQIFVSKAVKPTAAPTCPADGANPARPASATGAVQTFCWQQVGAERLASGQAAPNNTTDPTLNVDTHRDGVEPDIAFTGNGFTTPWVVWYEQGTPTSGLESNQLVFAARAVPDTGAGVDGGFHWQVVGNAASGNLGAAANGCTTATGSLTAIQQEDACSLNKNPTQDDQAEDPQIAAGTMAAGGTAAPWVTWDEKVGGIKQVFVSRFVATPTPHFEIVNNGAPISVGANDSTRPDITFDGNTPYVSWREDIGGGVEKGFVGHFINPSNPTFILDESDVPLTPSTTADVREPISSGCTATPQNVGAGNTVACQGGATGTPFFLFTNGTSPLSLFADAYQPGTPTTGAATDVSQTSATLNGTVVPNGAVAHVHFDFGADTNYGSSTTPTPIGPDGTNATTGGQPASFSAALTGLTPGSTIHYRAVVTTDFGSFAGPDQTLTTPAPGDGAATAGRASVSGTSANVKISCTGSTGATCKVALKLTADETLKGGKVTTATARKKTTHRTVTVGTASVGLTAGQSQSVAVTLNRTGKSLLAKLHKVQAKLVVTQSLSGGTTATISSQTVTFKSKAPKKRHHH
jgi:hypothetical protein